MGKSHDGEYNAEEKRAEKGGDRHDERNLQACEQTRPALGPDRKILFHEKIPPN
jgi:hypothetical protein